MLRHLNKLHFIYFFLFYAGASLFYCAFGNQDYECVATLDLYEGTDDRKNINTKEMVTLSNGWLALIYERTLIKVLGLSEPDGHPYVVATLNEVNNESKDDSYITSLTPMPRQRLASSHDNGTIKIWDLTKPDGEQCVVILEGHTRFVDSVTVLSNGQLASASDDNTVKVWDLNRPYGDQCVTTLKGHTDCVGSVIQLSSGFLASASEDRTLKVWNLSMPDGEQCVATFMNQNKEEDLTYLTPLPGGRIVSCFDIRTAKVWDPSAPWLKEPVATLGVGESDDTLLFFTPLADGRLVSYGIGRIRVWDLNKPDGNQCEAILEGHISFVRSVIQMPNGWLASCSHDGTVKIWNLDRSHGQQCMATLEHNGKVGSVAALPHDRLVSLSSDGIVKVWDLNKPVSANTPSFANLRVSEASNPSGNCWMTTPQRTQSATLPDVEPVMTRRAKKKYL